MKSKGMDSWIGAQLAPYRRRDSGTDLPASRESVEGREGRMALSIVRSDIIDEQVARRAKK